MQQLAAAEPVAEPVAEEIEQNPSMTTRKINFHIPSQDINIESDDKGGTPNRCIARLIKACVKLHEEFEEIEGSGNMISEILFPTRKKGSKIRV